MESKGSKGERDSDDEEAEDVEEGGGRGCSAVGESSDGSKREGKLSIISVARPRATGNVNDNINKKHARSYLVI